VGKKKEKGEKEGEDKEGKGGTKEEGEEERTLTARRLAHLDPARQELQISQAAAERLNALVELVKIAPLRW
jgi:hypothetical protein